MLTQQIAKHLREVHLGGNWTASNLKDNLADVTWQEAIAKVNNLNSIAVLVFHINYYVEAILKVMQNRPLDAHDKFSFDLPPITSQADWDKLLEKTWTEMEALAAIIEKLPDDILLQDFAVKKYGNNIRNFFGLIEHCYYHLGQIAIIKKMLRANQTA